ncbi:hypothetical protein M0220_15535 [Halomonas qinghailakensis]|uniref:Uncharacterized protein n=1 Tax=Halomonas qinghailakensis TaxID=2937790 RepID=A0AA46TPT0_9GAMM|nr:hypothetical protein [Halomonas sp. ZZQ-149]UYO74269.1 hypothetical protein M0220_15535 [Halomonas sp. ZZQ-149]
MAPLHFTLPLRCFPWGKLKRANITIPVHVTRGPAIQGPVIQDIAIQDQAIQDIAIQDPAIQKQSIHAQVIPVLTTLAHSALVGIEMLLLRFA